MKYIIRRSPRLTVFLIGLLSIWVFLAFTGCGILKDKLALVPLSKINDLEEIEYADILKVGVQYKSAEIFMSDGKPSGYLYDLIKEFSDHININFELIPLNNEAEKIEKLSKGEIDLVAGLNKELIPSENESLFNFTTPINSSQLVLIQRERSKNKKIVKFESIDEFKDIDVFITKNFENNANINKIAEDNNLNIWVLNPEYDQFQVVEDIIEEKFDYAIVEKNIAKMFDIANENLNTKIAINETEDITWATHSYSEELSLKLNDWMLSKNNSLDLFSVYLKYYKNISDNKYSIVNTSSLAQYDDLVMKYADKIGMDWQLIAAIINQESNFKFDVISKSGAMGLMQVMPKTGKGYGITDLYNPESNIRAGTTHLKWLEKYWSKKITSDNERLNFILASYNCGSGHVEDARRLAEKYGKNPNIWHNNVDEFILKKSKRQYYKDEVVKYGFCRGKETYYYVLKVLNKYYNYKAKYTGRSLVRS